MKKLIIQSFLWLCFVGFSISNGHAQTYRAGCYRIVNKATGKVLEVEGNSLDSGARIRQATATGAANQLWQWLTYEYGWNSFISRSSNLALNTPNCTEGATIIQSSFLPGKAPSWLLYGKTNVADGYVYFRQCPIKAETNDDTVRMRNPTSFNLDFESLSDNFLWKIEKISCPSICSEPSISSTADTVCVGSTLKLNVINTSSSNPTVTWIYNGGFTPYVSGSVSSNGVVTGLYSGNLRVYATVYDGACITNLFKQVVVVNNCSFDPTKCYRIVSKVSNKSLEIKDASTTEGAQIFQWTTVAGKTNQLWQFTKQTDGKYTITSKNSGKLIDAPDCTEGGLSNNMLPMVRVVNDGFWSHKLMVRTKY